MQKNGNILKKRGFTLVELIVTIAIFAVIAAILVPTLLGFTKSARITSANRIILSSPILYSHRS